MSATVDLEFAELQVEPALAAQLKMRSTMDPAAIGEAIGKGFGALMGFVTRNGLKLAGQPRAIYTDYGTEGVSFTLALPLEQIAGGDIADPEIFVDSLPGLRAYRFTHHGPYPNLAQTYGQITEFMKDKGHMQSEADWASYMPMWEEYVSDPDVTPPEELLTYIYLPVCPDQNV